MKYLFALFLTLASFGSALADSRDSTVTTVPFDFVVGNTTFPAGTYTISRISDDPKQGLRIQSSDGKTNAFVLPTTLESAAPNDQPKLQFRHEGDKYFLSSISGGLDIYTVTPSRHHQKMANPDETIVTDVSP
ncbi:MAG TPA: hypothetical protein VE135_14520 [Pyrinomonadaceae bacterium]|jgi:hypothetical protein|nr:hypothetical protein [Pyrinomonadaceae bacterium]